MHIVVMIAVMFITNNSYGLVSKHVLHECHEFAPSASTSGRVGRASGIHDRNVISPTTSSVVTPEEMFILMDVIERDLESLVIHSSVVLHGAVVHAGVIHHGVVVHGVVLHEGHMIQGLVCHPDCAVDSSVIFGASSNIRHRGVVLAATNIGHLFS
jgi:hypothetical protein